MTRPALETSPCFGSCNRSVLSGHCSAPFPGETQLRLLQRKGFSISRSARMELPYSNPSLEDPLDLIQQLIPEDTQQILVDAVRKRLELEISKLKAEDIKVALQNFRQLVERRPAGASQHVLQDLPTLCLIGIGQCGTNICAEARDLLVQSFETGQQAQVPGAPVDDPRQGLYESLKNGILSIFFGSKGPAKAIALNAAEFPIIIAIDLDRSNITELSKKVQEKYPRFMAIPMDWAGGAGNIQAIGEYQALKMLMMTDSVVDGKPTAWKEVRRYAIDTVSCANNPTTMFFYIFSTGGGTGSGMSTQLGLAQKLAVANRRSQEKAASATVELADRPTISVGFGVLPEDTLTSELQGIPPQLNSGRMLVRLLASSGPDKGGNRKHKTLSPWNFTVLASNSAMEMASVVTETDAERRPYSYQQHRRLVNFYVAQQIFNLHSSQASAAETTAEEWDMYGIGTDDRIRLDAGDLEASFRGLVGMGYSRGAMKPEAPDDALANLLVQAFRIPEVVMETPKEGYIRGVSLLPEHPDHYEKFFAKSSGASKPEERASKLSRIPFFGQASSIVTIVSRPHDTQITREQFRQLRTTVTELFPAATTRRFAVARSLVPMTGISCFVVGNSAALAPESLSLIFLYIAKCFFNDCDFHEAYGLLTGPFDKALLGKDKTKAATVASELIVGLSKKMLEQERLEKFAEDFASVRNTHEGKFRELHSEGNFVGLDNLCLKKEHVLRALHEIIRVSVITPQKGKPVGPRSESSDE